MTRWIAVSAALISIGAITFVLRWGTSGRAGTPSFESAVFVLGIATPLASILLAWHLWRQGRRGSALLSCSPLVLMSVGTGLALGGIALPLTALLWLDLYVLLAFVAVLSRFGRNLLRPPIQTDAATARARPRASQRGHTMTLLAAGLGAAFLSGPALAQAPPTDRRAGRTQITAILGRWETHGTRTATRSMQWLRLRGDLRAGWRDHRLGPASVSDACVPANACLTPFGGGQYVDWRDGGHDCLAGFTD